MKINRTWRHWPVKRALLVGISYSHFDPSTCLTGIIKEINKLRDLLIDRYDYLPQDIVVMSDEDDMDPRLKPTKVNLLRQLRTLVANAREDDHFLFHFSGHSTQIPCKRGTEYDGKDETLLCADIKRIKDNKLRKMLVNPLPNGASLTAIFDCCNSGTLLDLEHYTCNDVYVPWVNKGGRKCDTLRNIISRKNAIHASPVEPYLLRAVPESFLTSIFESDTSGLLEYTRPIVGEDISEFSTRISSSNRRTSSRPMASISTDLANSVYYDDSGGFGYGYYECSSPEAKYSCQGTCRDRHENYPPHPLVVSVSSSKDSQTTWGDTGSSMTLLLIQILEKTPNPSYRHLMTELNYALHGSTMEMHRYAKAMRKHARMANQENLNEDSQHDYQVEMNDFQEPQLGSITPLNMDDQFVL